MKAFGQFVRFIVTGVTSLLVDLGVLHLMLTAGIAQEIAVAVAFLVGVGVNLVMHKFFTFRDSARLHGYQVVRYFIVVAINLAVTEAAVWIATQQLGMSPLAGKLLSLPPVLALGFTLSRTWVFVPRKGSGPT
ncbi:GtrA family protein [Caenimonas sp. SL110]|uniref:GtrA family protein n=1 Tax=Caenimonas sp. SL110 TaxID=1450524 RepID=UPI00065318D4|nr:GtrA family protein [Caenimonas sp. SL110]